MIIIKENNVLYLHFKMHINRLHGNCFTVNIVHERQDFFGKIFWKFIV